MSDLQLAKEMFNTGGFIIISDGTTYRTVKFESRHVYMKVPDYNIDGFSEEKYGSCLIGVDSATDHSSQIQLMAGRKG